jgi:hypothetical protein
MGGYETSVSSSTMYKGGSKTSVDYSHTHLYLELWTPSAKFLASKSKKGIGKKDHQQLARIDLFTDFPTLNNPSNIYLTDYSGEGHIRNWGPGILKNYLQILMQMLDAGKEVKLYSQQLEDPKVKELKNKTLYVPDYVLTKFNKFSGDETKKHEEKDIFEDYKFKYQLLPIAELNKKILEDKEPFYYLVYIKSSTDKFLTIINSSTGEIIYKVYYPASYNINSDNLEDLCKTITE